MSNGDKVLDKPLALIGGKGHFTKELEDAMLAGEADIAVHSLKDVPTYIPEGLELASVTARQDQSDVFLSHTYKSLEDSILIDKLAYKSENTLIQEKVDINKIKIEWPWI